MPVLVFLMLIVSNLLGQTTVFSDSFTGSFPGSWSVGNDGGITGTMWGNNSYKSSGDGWSAFCADNGNNSANTYPNSLKTYMERRNVSLVGYTSATLSFKYYGKIESNFDFFTVNIKSQNGSWTEAFKTSGSFSSWTTKTINLNSFCGQSGLTVQFRFDSDGRTTDQGIWIDEVSLIANKASTVSNLTVTVKNIDGVARSNAAVVLYDASYKELKTVSTNSSGQATFSNLANGTYNYEAYYTPSISNLPVANNKEYWGSGTVTISGSSISHSFTRIAPYISVGPTFNPANLNTGQQTSGNFTVKNTLPYLADSYVAVWVDRDKVSSWDYSSNNSATAKSISIGGTSAFPFNITPTINGTYSCYAFVYSKINGTYIITDQYNWTQAFTVTTAATYNLTVTVKNIDGVARSNAAVVLYDASYKELKTVSTNSSGQATFSNLANGTYNYEAYYTPSISNLPVANNKEYWGSGTVTISGSSISHSFTRIAPYISVGPTFNPANLNTGQQTSGNFTVKNTLPYLADSYVAVWVDRDKVSSWDYSSNNSATAKSISIGGTSAFPFNITPTINGTYSCYAFVYSKINGTYIITDQYNWTQAFTLSDAISQIKWSDEIWNVRTGTGGPGPNNWLASNSNVWVDASGNLHLKIIKNGDKWYCAEISSVKSFGYGEYTFQVSSNVENLDKNIVLGLFTYKGDHEEIDIEFSRWGSILNNAGNFTVQPSSSSSAKSTIDFPLNLTGGYADSYSTHKFIWNPSEVDFLSYYGHNLPVSNNIIKDWQYTGSNIPTHNNEKVILNLWLYNGVDRPQNQQDAEVIIKSFSFKPPSITVTSPKGGEYWQIGSKQNITWNSTGITGNVNIEVNGNYPDGKWEPLQTNTPNDGAESMIITGQAGIAKRIRITSVNNPSISDISDVNLTYGSSIIVTEENPKDLLGIKKPLLLIHGIQLKGIPSDPDIKLWENFISFFTFDNALTEKYKIYYVKYISNVKSVADLANELRHELDKKTEFNGKQISIVAHSMGGLIIRSFMNQTVNGIKGGERVDRLITLGTPHHGSPMSNGPARYSALDPITATEIFEADQLIYTRNNPTYYQYNRSDLRWDNYDNLFNYNKYVEERNDWLAGSLMNNNRTYDNKIIAYAGSLDFDIFNLDAAYVLSDLIITNMYTWRFFRNQITDGIVPYNSATYDGHILKKVPRFFIGYNHSELAKGKMIFDQVLFGQLKADLLEELLIPILNIEPDNPLDYGNLVVNVYNDKIFKIRNTGSCELKITALTISPNSDQFSIISPINSAFALAVDGLQEVIVRFKPTSIGLKTAVLNIANNSDKASPNKTISLSGTGIVKTFNAPTITTTAVTAIELTGATSGGNIISDGGGTISAKGICWGTTANPTISLPNSRTSEGAGTGTFSSKITGLTAGSTYHVRAYATNASGTAYGSDISFTTNTNVVIPSVTTNSVFDLKITEVSSGGKIISDGGAAVTARGVCWSSVINPTIANLKTSDGTGIGTFISSISDLTAGSTYHVRAYATNSAGTSYGEDISFTTNTVIIIPTINTLETYNLTDSEVSTGGHIISDGGSTITKRGVCWSTLINPTIELDTKTSEGTGNGVFSSNITGLISNTAYHIRAYAINSVGTAYGEDISFTTMKEIALDANFSVAPISDCTSLTVNFADESTGYPTAWAWDIDNDGITDYTDENPTHTYSTVGTYSVKLTVTNAAGNISIKTSNIVINAQTLIPTAPTVGIISQPTCNLATGSVVLSGLPSTESYALIRSPDGTTITDNRTIITISGLEAGTYSFKVNNATGCTSNASAEVVINPFASSPIAPIIEPISHPTCAIATGIINVTAPTGSGMTYSINGSDFSNTTGRFNLVPVGTYTVTARNFEGCISTGTSVTINAQPSTPDAPTAVASLQPNCVVSTGTITVTAPIGSGMTFSINGLAYTNTTGIFTLVSAGTYSVTARSAAGCTSNGTSVTINAQPTTPAPPTATSTLQPTCTVSTGTIAVTAPTGSGMTYSRDGLNYTNTSGTFTLVPAGNWSVTARSAAGCTSDPTIVTINAQPPKPGTPAATASLQPTCTISTGSITVTSPTGSGMTYSRDGLNYTNTTGIFTLVPAGNWSVTARSATGCTSDPTIVTINAQPPTPAPPTATATLQPSCTVATGTITVTAPSGSGMTYSINGLNYTNTTGIFTLVPTGTYTVTAKSAAGCISAGTNVTVNPQPPTPLSPTATATLQPSCTVATGTITVTAPTGSGMTYSINGSAYTNTTGIFTLVPAGTWSVTARNAAGCTSNGTSVIINPQPTTPTPPALGIITQPAKLVTNGSVVLNGLPGTGSWTLTATPGGTTTTGSGISKPISGLSSGTYSYTVTNASGCTSVSSANVVIHAQPAAPTGLEATSCNDLATIKWRKNSDPNFSLYRIYGGTESNPTTKIDSATNSISDTSKVFSGFTRGLTYYFRVTAVNIGKAESNFSVESTAAIKTGVIPKIKAKWGDLLICSNLGDSITNFQWFNGNSIVPSAIGQYYSAGKQIGIYRVETIDKNGCKNSSNTVQITANTKSLTVYPNPASVSFALRLMDTSELKNASAESAIVSLINSAGQKVLEFKAMNANDELLKAIPVSNLPNGVYIVQVLVNQEDLYYTKIVVLK